MYNSSKQIKKEKVVQSVQISDEIAIQLNTIALENHITNSEIVESLLKVYIGENKKISDLNNFFKSYQKDISGYKFNRDEANAR